MQWFLSPSLFFFVCLFRWWSANEHCSVNKLIWRFLFVVVECWPYELFLFNHHFHLWCEHSIVFYIYDVIFHWILSTQHTYIKVNGYTLHLDVVFFLLSFLISLSQLSHIQLTSLFRRLISFNCEDSFSKYYVMIVIECIIFGYFVSFSIEIQLQFIVLCSCARVLVCSRTRNTIKNIFNWISSR